MAKRDLVKFKASKVANTTVRGETARYNVYTNPDDPAVAELELDRKIAAQLVKAGVGSIEGEDDEAVIRSLTLGDAAEDDTGADDGTGRNGGTVERNAARRLEEGTEGDNRVEGVSGADTRDTTAFAGRPLEDYGNTGAGDDADAPPAEGGEGEDGDAGGEGTQAEPKPAAKPRRRRSRAKAKPAAAGGEG